MRQILGLVGKMGAGKDTVASFLTRLKSWERIAFSDALYEEVSAAFGASVDRLQNRATKETPTLGLALYRCLDPDFIEVALESTIAEDEAAGVTQTHRMIVPRSPRRILQVWGTEYRRRINEEYWTRKVEQKLVNNPKTNFVVTDVRFPNEADLLMRHGARIVPVVRPDQKSVEDARTKHDSENMMTHYSGLDAPLINNEGSEGLVNLCIETITRFYHKEQ